MTEAGAGTRDPLTLGAFAGPDAPDPDALRTCVHCGICLPQCPTYRVLGQEADSPRGRVYLMRAAAEGRIGLTDEMRRHLDLCLGCRACETACPSGVPFGSLLEATRAQLHRAARPGMLERLAESVVPEPGRLGRVLAPLRVYQRSGLRRMVRGSGLLRRWPRLAAIEGLLPDIPAGATLPARVPATGKARGRAGLLSGCVQRHLFPGVNEATIRLLSLAGWEVVVPPDQGCCGALDLHAGRLDAYRTRVRRLAEVFADVDLVVTNAAGCGSALKDAARWLGDDRGQALAAQARDVSEVLVEAELPLRPLDLTVTYHDACHLAHAQRVRAQPRVLLQRIPGLRLVELRDSDLCCGSAGTYNLLQPEMAERLLEMKLARLAETGARVVATGNPGCLLQIARGARERRLDLEVVHPVELLARALAGA